jgi:hypothetical protein
MNDLKGGEADPDSSNEGGKWGMALVGEVFDGAYELD